MLKKYGLMLIGCGHIGGEHLDHLYYRDEFSVEAVVDVECDRAREFAKKYNAKKYGTDYRRFLNSKSVDIVIIATYADTHLEIVKDCFSAGKHVLCEKPIAVNMKEALSFYSLVKKSECKLLTAHILRHNKSYIKIADLIESGEIGQLRLMRMIQNHHTMNWGRYKRLMEDCPPVVDCGVHYIDVMQWFSGSTVSEVSGFSTALESDTDIENYGMIHLRLKNGCIGYYEAGWGKNIAAQNLKEFIGDKGRISLTLMENRSENREEGDLITVYKHDTGEYSTINVQSVYKDMYAQMKNLVDMIENGAPANPDIDAVMSAFNVALTAVEAIKEKKVLEVKNPFIPTRNLSVLRTAEI